MDALLALFAELWWVAPAAAASGGAGVVVVRRRRRGRMRRLELDAARGDVRTARAELARARADVHGARAEVIRAEGDRSSIAAARRGLAEAEHATRVAVTELVARRAEARAARTALPPRRSAPSAMPLARLIARHDAVLASWVVYETDPALAIAYPAMTDPRFPATAAFLDTLDRARWLRPRSAAERIAPSDYSAYRDAVSRMQRSFAVAQHDARRAAGDTRETASPTGRAGAAWQDIAHQVVDGVDRVLVWSETLIGRSAASGARPPRADRHPPA